MFIKSGKLVLKTYVNKDFRKPPDSPEAWFNSTNQTSILIIKKINNSFNFIDWVKYGKTSTELNKVETVEAVRSQTKTLIIDDEADEASINVSRHDDIVKYMKK